MPHTSVASPSSSMFPVHSNYEVVLMSRGLGKLVESCKSKGIEACRWDTKNHYCVLAVPLRADANFQEARDRVQGSFTLDISSLEKNGNQVVLIKFSAVPGNAGPYGEVHSEYFLSMILGDDDRHQAIIAAKSLLPFV